MKGDKELWVMEGKLSPLPTAAWPAYLEVWDLVAFPQRDLEYIHGADESCKPCQTLLATATHTNQQRISPRGLKDAIDVAATKKKVEKKEESMVSVRLSVSE